MVQESLIDRERIARKPLVGVDGEGDEHRFDWYRDTVYVLGPDGSVEHVETLKPDQLSDWVSYVTEKRGWQDCRYSDRAPFAAIAETLAPLLEPTRDDRTAD